MFTNESTENLLDNLENELTEMIELEQPSTSKQTVADIEMQKPPEIEAPVPAKRSFNPSPSVHPIPAARRLQSRDKNEKNDENEIIQLSSISSDLMHSSASSSPHAKINISQASSLQSGKNTIIMVNEKKKQNSSILMVHEAEMPPDGRDDETFFVIKHGKWANGSNSLRNDQKIVVEQEPQTVQQKPPIEVVVENSKKKKPSNDDVISVSSTSQSNGGIAASSSSSSSESPEPVKRSKSKARKKKKSKHSESSDGRSAATGSTNEINIVKHAPATDRAIGIFIHSTGIIKYNNNLKNLSIKISIYNEDNGKMIFDAISTKAGKFNDDFW